jgi:hypothetical protein
MPQGLAIYFRSFKRTVPKQTAFDTSGRHPAAWVTHALNFLKQRVQVAIPIPRSHHSLNVRDFAEPRFKPTEYNDRYET